MKTPSFIEQDTQVLSTVRAPETMDMKDVERVFAISKINRKIN